jgi:hypothetical protein
VRTKPYTVAGLRRVSCVHCGAPATAQWSLRPCAIGRLGWYALCDAHDLELNTHLLAFLRVPDAGERLAAYIAERTPT